MSKCHFVGNLMHWLNLKLEAPNSGVLANMGPDTRKPVIVAYKQHKRRPACAPGGTLIFSYIHRLGSLLGFKILNFIIFGGFQKNEYFWGYEDFVDIFGGSSQNWTKFRGHFYAF